MRTLDSEGWIFTPQTEPRWEATNSRSFVPSSWLVGRTQGRTQSLPAYPCSIAATDCASSPALSQRSVGHSAAPEILASSSTSSVLATVDRRPRKSGCFQSPTWMWASMITASYRCKTLPPSVAPHGRWAHRQLLDLIGQILDRLGGGVGLDLDWEALFDAQLVIEQRHPMGTHR